MMIIKLCTVHLGIRKAGMNYIRFRDVKQPIPTETTQLIDRIRAELSKHMDAAVPVTSVVPLHDEVSSSPAQQKSSVEETYQSTAVLAPIEQWTHADIHLWFAQQHILEQLRDLYQFQSGTEMLEYAQDLVNDRVTQQQTYSRLFVKKYGGDELPPHQFNRFANAIGQLLKENSVGHDVVKKALSPPSNTSQTKSGACLLS
jgi:hypothetical protein